MTPSYALGLFFIVCVSVIWTIASVVIQYIYHEHQFNSPYLITYIGTSLFTVLLPTRLFWERRQRCCKKVRHRGSNVVLGGGCRTTPQQQKEMDEALEMQIIPWKTTTPTTSTSAGVSNTYLSVSPTESVSSSGSSSPFNPNDSVENGIIARDGFVVDENDSTHSDENDNHDFSPQFAAATTRLNLLSHQQHFRIAAKIAPVWFFANWAYNASLQYTSITSSTVLASTGSLFTFLFAITSGDERFTVIKLTGVLLGVVGSILTGLHDVNSASDGDNSTIRRFLAETITVVDASTTATNTTQVVDAVTAGGGGTLPHHHGHPGGFDPFHWVEGNHELFGDFIGLLSAVGYGAYTVMIRVLCPRDERRMSMQLLLGYIGLLNAICLSPLTVHVLLSPSGSPMNDTSSSVTVDGTTAAAGNNFPQGVDTMTPTPASGSDQLTWVVLGYLVMNGLLDNVLSDYLWARSVVLTSATVATVGLGLTIPLAFISDWILGNGYEADWMSICGASSVLIGFVLVNIDYEETDYQAELQISRHD